MEQILKPKFRVPFSSLDIIFNLSKCFVIKGTRTTIVGKQKVVSNEKERGREREGEREKWD